MNPCRCLLTLCVLACLLLVPRAGTAQGQKEKHSARQAAEGYLAAALAGKVKEAQALAEPGQTDASEARIIELKKRLVVKQVSLSRMYVSDKGGRALAISEVVQFAGERRDEQMQGQLVVTVSLRDKRWLVREVDFRPQANAKEYVERFHRKYPDAKELAR